MEKLYTSKTFLKMAGGRMHTLHSTPLGSASGHKLRKPSKEFGHLALGFPFFPDFQLPGNPEKFSGSRKSSRLPGFGKFAVKFFGKIFRA